MRENTPLRPGIGFLTLMTTALALSALLAVPVSTLAQGVPSQASSGPLQILQVRPNFYMIVGAGGNIAVQVGDDGIVVVNTGTAALSEQVSEAISHLAPGKGVVEIINTSSDADLIGGNARVRSIRPAGWAAPMLLSTQEALNRMIAAELPQEQLPRDTMLLESRKALYFNGEGIEVLRAPAAHSDGDLMVFFRRSDVLVVGKVIDTDRFPRIDVADGGSIQGELDALNRAIQIAIPSVPYVFQPGGTIVIPGHGRLYEQADVVQYRDMITIIRDEVQALMGRKQTLAQVQRANPVQGYEGQYGATEGEWTTNDFIAAVYRSLTKQPAYAALERDTGVKLK